MTQFPPSAIPNLDVQPVREQRTSVMAVIGFILALLGLVPLCCIPVIGPGVAVAGGALCIVSLLMIVGSSGRLRGRGLAVAGIVLSTLGLLAGGLVTVGVMKFPGMLTPYGDAMAAIEAQDSNALSNVLSAGAMGKIDASRLAAFRDEYHASLGKFVAIKQQGVLDSFKEWGLVANSGNDPGVLMQRYQNHMPCFMGAEFEKGSATVFVFVDSNSNRGGGGGKYMFGPGSDVVIVPHASGSTPIWLIPSK